MIFKIGAALEVAGEIPSTATAAVCVLPTGLEVIGLLRFLSSQTAAGDRRYRCRLCPHVSSQTGVT